MIGEIARMAGKISRMTEKIFPVHGSVSPVIEKKMARNISRSEIIPYFHGFDW
jgi:hypothetical protein